MMKRKLLAIGSVSLLCAAGLGVGIPAANAAVALVSVKASTSTVVLNGDAGCGDRLSMTVKVNQPTAEDAYVSVLTEVIAPNGDNVDYLFYLSSKRAGDTVTYTDAALLCGFYGPGRYRLHTTVSWFGVGDSNEQSQELAFNVKRPTSLTFNASPEPVKKNTNLTVAGQLKFDPYSYGPAYGPKGIKLSLDFKATGSSSYVHKATITTGTSGKYSGKIKATASGTWRMTYPVNNTRQSQVKTDAVVLK